MALFYAGEYFTPEEKARDFAFYERLTVRDSSLSAASKRPWRPRSVTSSSPTTTSPKPRYSTSTTSSTTPRDGVHIASLAGACTAAIVGFGGLRDLGGKLSFVPRLPQALTRLALNLRARETTRLRIEVGQTQATYTLLLGERSTSTTTVSRSQ